MSKTITISDEQYKEIKDKIQEKKEKGVTIYHRNGSVLFETNQDTIRKAAEEKKYNLSGSNLSGSNLSGSNLSGSDLSDSDLSGSNLRGSNLRSSDFFHALFFGRGGTTKIKKSQVDDFFKALGVIVEE